MPAQAPPSPGASSRDPRLESFRGAPFQGGTAPDGWTCRLLAADQDVIGALSAERPANHAVIGAGFQAGDADVVCFQ